MSSVTCLIFCVLCEQTGVSYAAWRCDGYFLKPVKRGHKENRSENGSIVGAAVTAKVQAGFIAAKRRPFFRATVASN